MPDAADFDKQLDVIAAERATLANALNQATNDSDKQKILDQLGDLQDLQNQIIFGAFMSEAAVVAALTSNLNDMITELRGHIDSLFLDQLINIGKKNGLLSAGGGGGAPAQGGGATGGQGGGASGGGTPGAGGQTGTGGSTGGTAGSSSANERGIDCALDCTKLAKTISGNGLQFVIRYYRGKSKYPSLSADEAAALSSANLKIVTIWESASDNISHFSHSTGVDEGTSAYRQALVVGQPPNTPIYFAVDADFSSEEIAGPVTDYFRGIADGFNAIGQQSPVYVIGVYGSGLTCSTLLAHGLARFSWLAMSTGWRGSKTFNDWNIKQSDPTIDLGLDHDADVARPGYGGFRVAT
jgi:Domain of unknown function (DUF1906)